MPSRTRWTNRRIRWALLLAYGPNRRGNVNIAAVADRLEVSQTTVRRWLAGGPRTTVPARHLDRITAALLPAGSTLHQERLDADYAREAIARLGLGRGRGVLPVWRERQWLEPHTVVVLVTPVPDVLQVAFCRDDHRPVREMHRRGVILDSITVANRFHAVVLVHAMLEQMHDWRVAAGNHLPAGVTRGFAGFAQRPTLHDLANGDEIIRVTAARYPLPTAARSTAEPEATHEPTAKDEPARDGARGHS